MFDERDDRSSVSTGIFSTDMMAPRQSSQRLCNLRQPISFIAGCIRVVSEQDRHGDIGGEYSSQA